MKITAAEVTVAKIPKEIFGVLEVIIPTNQNKNYDF
jgi:hypothetical protein